MAALEEGARAYSASFESENSLEEELEESLELGKTTNTDPSSDMNEERSKAEEMPSKTRHQQGVSAQKPPLAQRVSTSRGGTHLEMTGVRKQLASQKTIPRSQHLNSSIAATENDASLALSDQCRQNSSQSSQLRDAVFAEWLAEKGSHMKKERQAAALKKRHQEQEKAEKTAAREARMADSVQKWMDSKSLHMRASRQRQREEEERKKLQEEEKLEKEKESEVAAKNWRDEQTKKLMKEQRRRKREEDEREKAKCEEMEEKITGANQAFKAWSEKKDEQRAQALRQLQIEEKKKAQQKANDLENRVNEASSAYQAWKTAKDQKIKQAGSLYTYNKDPRQPPKNRWCPARSVKYPYLVTGSTSAVKPVRPFSQASTRSRTREDSRALSVASYSSCSFESEGSLREEASPEEGAVERSSRVEGGGGEREGERRTGRLKTVHVCCQIVEFWCTCEDCDEKDEEETKN